MLSRLFGSAAAHIEAVLLIARLRFIVVEVPAGSTVQGLHDEKGVLAFHLSNHDVITVQSVNAA
jgi:hypothetical protein